MELGSRTWPELAAGARPLVAIPLGSCEQHGPHLPLDTDTRIAVALAERLAEARPGVLVGPTLAFGASWEHHGFTGLLSIEQSLLSDLLVELARSADWSAGLVFVNGHGGNLHGVYEAVDRITFEERRALAWFPRVRGGDPHAGRTETSIMLALAPELVRVDALAPGWTGDLTEVRESGLKAVTPTGVLGDPTGATAEEGRRLLDELAEDLVRCVDRWNV